MLNPPNLSVAFGFAKIQEEYPYASRRSTKPWSEVPRSSTLGLPLAKKVESKTFKPST